MRKIELAIVRQNCQNRQPDEKGLQYPQVRADGPDAADDRIINADDTAAEGRQPENRMGKRDQKGADGADVSDDVLRPYSDQAGPARDCTEAGEGRVGGPLINEGRRLLDVAAAREQRDRRRSDPTGDRGDPLEPLSAKGPLLTDQGDQGDHEAQGHQVRVMLPLPLLITAPPPQTLYPWCTGWVLAVQEVLKRRWRANLAGDHSIR